MKQILMLLVTVIGAMSIMTGQAFAATACNPATPAGPDPKNPYQVNVTSLPHATACADKTQTVLDIVFAIIGAISLLMITIGGFRYIISQGDPQAVSKAKGTIIYALVGLVVSILAVAIVTFVIGKT